MRKFRKGKLKTFITWFFSIVFIVSIFTEPLYAQRRRKRRLRIKDVSTLDLRQKEIQDRVKKTEELLQDARKHKNRSASELGLLQKQISLRESLLGSLSSNITNIDDEISGIDGMIASMEKDVVSFQKSYSKAAVISYKTQDDLSTLMWCFSSENFFQAYDRVMYFKEFARYRKNQILLVKRTRKYLADKKLEKENKKNEKANLLNVRVEEKKLLDNAIAEKAKVYNDVKRNEVQYQKEIANFRNELAEIRSRIKQLVLVSKREVSRAKTEVVEKLSNNFENNKGKLPWPMPMNSGVITGQFGKTTSPTGGEIINDGIFISTKAGQRIRAVYNGTVTMITKVPTYGKVVIVQHGDYRSVYANLEEVYVNKGDQINVLQDIGSVKTNNHTGETQLYFQIYRNFNPVNPLSWINNRE